MVVSTAVERVFQLAVVKGCVVVYTMVATRVAWKVSIVVGEMDGKVVAETAAMLVGPMVETMGVMASTMAAALV